MLHWRFFVGMMGYADDAIILAPSVLSMNMMLSVTSKFDNEFDVKFNPVLKSVASVYCLEVG